MVATHGVRCEFRQTRGPSHFLQYRLQGELTDEPVIDSMINLAGLPQFYGRAILPFGLKTRAGLPKIMAPDEKQDPWSTLIPSKAEDRSHSVSRGFRFALENGISARRYIHEVKNERLP